MSSLPIALYCGHSAKLSNEHGAGRAAFQSTAYHAKIADDPEWTTLWARLTPEEQEEASGWAMPSDVDLGNGVVLKLEDAHKEIEVKLDSSLSCPLMGSKHPVSTGHIDFCWDPVIMEDGTKVVYVGDAKRTRFTSEVDSLQLDAYGWAWALKCGADAYGVGLWILEDHEWVWRKEFVYIDSFEALAIGQKLSIAIANEGEAVTGDHCSSCYGRQYCKEYLLPTMEGIPASLSEPGGLNDDNIIEAYNYYKAQEKIAEAAKKQVSEYIRARGSVPLGDGKVLKYLVAKNSQMVFDKKRFLDEHPDLANEYMKEAPPKNMGLRKVKG